MPSLSQHLGSLFWVAAGGAATALVWDLYRVMKAAFGIRRSVAAALLDLAFGAACGLFVFGWLFVANGGELRLATLLGLASGMAVYAWVLSPLVVWAAWNLAGMAMGLTRTAVALLWWVTRRPRPWGIP